MRQVVEYGCIVSFMVNIDQVLLVDILHLTYGLIEYGFILSPIFKGQR